MTFPDEMGINVYSYPKEGITEITEIEKKKKVSPKSSLVNQQVYQCCLQKHG